MSKEALKLAVSVLKGAQEYKRGHTTFVDAVEELEEALAEQPAPMQGWKPSEADYKEWWGRHGLHGPTARAAFEDAASLYLTAAPQPAQQEPVAHMNQHGVIHEAGYPWEPTNRLEPLYTTPPQRTWVGLSEEEKIKCASPYDSRLCCVEETEAKLKEKNT